MTQDQIYIAIAHLEREARDLARTAREKEHDAEERMLLLVEKNALEAVIKELKKLAKVARGKGSRPRSPQ
jgi:hypothetical protein